MPGALSKVGAAIQLMRPLNLLLSMAGVAVGAEMASSSGAFRDGNAIPVALAMLSAAAITAAANAINDVYDVAIDRINRPDRPIPSGRLSRRSGQVVWLSTAVLGVGAGFALRLIHVLIAVISVVMVFSYSYRLKQWGFIGNLVVAVMVSITLIFGALAIGDPGYVWVGCAAAFLLTLAREVVKDLQDVKGDVEHGVASIPAILGARNARALVVSLIAVTIAFAPLPYTHLAFSGIYLFFVLIACLLLLGAIAYLASRAPGFDAYSRSSSLLKTAMAIGMVGLFFS